ncbi:MAG: HTH domain-containing protein [Bacteroidales bacterium]|nr:HTH domain-containing protein [Bacteroidales bacterium]
MHSSETHIETHVETQDGTHVRSIREERQDKLIQLVHKHPEFTMEEMAGEMGISRTSVYRLIKSMNGKVKYRQAKERV